MAKILMGVVAAIVIAAGGYFGFEFYVQHRVAGEVEAAFEQIRATGAKASHGKVSFDRSTRTVTVADIAAESAAQPPLTLKIASFTASGVSQPDATRFSADSIEITGVEVGAGMAAPAGWHATYRAPRIIVKDYSGPAGLPRQPASSSTIDLARFAIEQFAAVTASSITAPSLAATINLPAGPQSAQAVSYNYSNLALRDIKDGKIAMINAGRAAFTADVQQGNQTEKIGGEFASMAAYDFDARAVLAMLDPALANDGKYYRAYRRITMGAYTAAFQKGMQMRMDDFTIDDIGLRPSKLQFPQLTAFIASAPPPESTPTPAQTRDVLEKMAGLYEGLRVGNAEMRGLAMEMPEGTLKLAAIRFNLEDGKIGEFALEGLDTSSPKGLFKVGRFALKSLDVANLLRMSAQFSNAAQKPSPDQLMGLFLLLEGAEVKGVVAPYKNSDKLVNIDTFNLSWGQFVGPIPSKAHLAAKLTSPLEATDPNLTPLIAAGIDTAAIDFDLGAAWAEASHTFALDLLNLELGSVFKASMRVSLANVPREAFSPNLLQAMATAGQIEAGPMELAVRDLGGVDLAVAQYARSQNVSREVARRTIIENIEASAKTSTAGPDALAVAEALAHFIENPGGALIIKLTPLGKVPALQLIQVMKTDPMIALTQFQVEVSTGL
jgi:hypothetical protein